jgi:hypothetical protein
MKSKFEHKPLGSVSDWLGALNTKASEKGLLDLPDYVLEDPLYNSPDRSILFTCIEEDTNELLHVVVISSMDGVFWFCWLIERQRFEIMEADLLETE